MALFDFLKTAIPHVRIRDDSLWLTKRAKLEGVEYELQRTFDSGDAPAAVILIGHFPACVKELEEFVGTRLGDEPRVIVALAERLAAAGASLDSLNRTHRIEVHVVERHPLLSREQPIIQFARRLPCRCRMGHHLSLEDPVIRWVLAGSGVEKWLRQLGMNENQSIESTFVTSRIRSALKKLERASTGDTPAESAEAWLAQNCPARWRG